MKRFLAFLLICTLLVTQPVLLKAEEPSDTEEEQSEELPASRESAEFSRALARMGQVYDPALSALTIPDVLQKSAPKDYTVMIYMIGSNLESIGAAATNDLAEIEASGVDYGKANVIAYTGGSRRWFSDIPCDRNSILDMSKPAEERIIASTEANADMGAPLTLSNYINFCTEYYPAEHYMLVFWDHGGGPILGYGNDELFSSDALLLSELREAMDSTIFAKDQKLDLVGFDACLMGSLENMVLWSEYADYYIGSEELEPGDGWNYAFLSTLNKSQDPAEIGRSVVDNYQTYYEAKISDTYNPDLTLSLIDLSKAQQTVEAVSNISEEMSGDLTSTGFASIQRTRSDVKSFGFVPAASEDETATYFDLADLKDLAAQFADAYPKTAQKVMDAVDDMVVHQYASMNNASGVSMYFPSQNKWMYVGGENVLQEASVSDTYRFFLGKYASRWVESKAHDWLLGALSEEDDYYTIQLTEDQLESAAGCYLEILHLNFADNYVPALTNYQLKIEEDGTVRVPKDPDMILLSSDDDSDGAATMWPVTITEQSEDRIVYHLDRTRVTNSLEMDVSSGDVVSENVDISISAEPGSDDVKIMDVKAASGIGTQGKNSIDINGWECLSYNWNGYLINKGVKGETLPYTQWERDYIGMTFFSIDKGFTIEKKPLSQISGDFVFQVLLKDTTGDVYATDVQKVTGGNDTHVEADTPKGKLGFTISDGEAYVDQYAGSDERLEIPDTVEGVPVTAIGEVDTTNETVTEIILPDSIKKLGHSSLKGFRGLTKIQLNEGLETIGSFSFNRTQVTELDLPSTVRVIEKGAFGHMRALTKVDLNSGIETMHTGILLDCPVLTSITVDGKDTASGKGYKLEKGVLYAPDQKTLVAYPGAGPTTYTVLPGTETIGYGAFYGSLIQSVTLPDSLKTIGHYAFYDCMSLQVPTLPNGLTTIRSQAFGAAIWSLTVAQDSMEKQTIKIPASVEKIDIGAFDVFQARSFEVDPANKYYSALDGALMNLRGDCIIATASDGRGVLELPDGALSFDWDLLDYLDNYTGDYLSLQQFDIIFPASVTQLPLEDYYTSADKICFHCPAGSAAEAYAIEHGIKYDHLTDLTFTLQEEKQEDGTVLTFRVYNDHAMLEHVTTEAAVLKVPDTVSGKPVTAIGTGSYDLLKDPEEMFSFDNNNTVTEIQLPASVTELNDDSLQSFVSLEKINLPDGLIYMGANALPYGYDLEKIPAQVRTLGAGFASSSAKTIELPASLISFSKGAFTNFKELESFTVAAGNEAFTAKDGVLFDTTGTVLVSYPLGADPKYTVPEGVLEIGQGAFYYNDTLQEVKLPASLIYIGQEAFTYCSSLQQIDLPEGLQELGSHAFYNCSGLTTITIPASVSKIDTYCFWACEALADVKLQEGLLEIGDSAFYNTGLVSIDLPDSVESIGYSTFGMSTSEIKELRGKPYTLHIGPNLTSINSNSFISFPVEAYDVDPENPAYASVDGFLTDRSGDRLLSCPPGVTGEVHVPDSVTWLNYSCFETALFMTDLYIPATVTKVEYLSLPTDYVKDDNGDYQTIYRAKIHCKKGSAAETYALDNDIPYVID